MFTARAALAGARAYGTEAKGIICSACKAVVSEQRVFELYQARRLVDLTTESKCAALKNIGTFDVKEKCALFSALDRVSFAVLEISPPPNVIAYDAESSTLFLETIVPSPEEGEGDKRGDHGLEVKRILEAESHLLPAIRSLVDIGGLNTTTINRLTQLFGEELKTLLIEISRAAPALVSDTGEIRFAIGGVEELLTHPKSLSAIEKALSPKPTLFLMNNFLNVLDPITGWRTLKTIWETVHPGDHIFITGLAPSQLETATLKQAESEKGLIAFRNKKGEFHKSSIDMEAFTSAIEEELEGAQLVKFDSFEYSIRASVRAKVKTPIASIWVLIKRDDGVK